MVRTRMIKSVSFILIICILISGCSLYKKDDNLSASVSSNHPKDNDTLEETLISQEKQYEDTRILTIEAKVASVPADTLANIKLEMDEAALKGMVDDLCISIYPQLDESIIDGASNWSIVSDDETLVFSFSCYREGSLMGVARYFDVSRDLNGKMVDPNNTYIPHYITDHMPDGVTFSAEEAGDKIANLLSQYSCFTFTPWSVTAGYDDQEQQGYYHAFMQQHYNGFPVYGNELSKVSAFISPDGIFSFGGTILLKEYEENRLSNMMSLSEAIEVFSGNFPVYAIGDTVVCNKITFGYIATLQNDVISLSPAWIFECTDKNSENDIIRYYNCACLIESGEFWIESL